MNVFGETALMVVMLALPAWSVTVAFDVQGVKTVAPQAMVVDGAGVFGELPEPVEPSGMSFDGWWIVRSGVESVVRAGDDVSLTNDAVLRARWNALPVGLTTVDTRLTFDTQGVGAAPAEKLLLDGAELYGNLPVPKAPIGQEFGGWWVTCRNGLSALAREGEAVLLPEDCVLRAKWNGVAQTFAIIDTGEGQSGSVVVPMSNGQSVALPKTWFSEHGLKGDDLTTLAQQTSPGSDGRGKCDARGNPICVWQDYVAGTNPNDSDDQMEVKIEIVDGKPKISWHPAMNGTDADGNGIRLGSRLYRIWGCNDLNGEWQEVDSSDGWKFFRVTVEMNPFAL